MSIEILVTGDFCPHDRTIPLVQTGTGKKSGMISYLIRCRLISLLLIWNVRLQIKN